ncbi:MAG: CidA/LrgA family protein [Candidatus Competibacter denitrificans]
MIAALAVLLAFQLLGEAIAQVGHLPIPGPVIGMVLLFLALQWHSALPESLRTTVQTLLSHLSLLFVPAGVGIIQYGALLAKEWLALTLAILISTILTIAMTALVMRVLMHRNGADPSDD